MPEKIYSFNGKDITMNICIQIRDVVKLLQEHFHIAFEEAVLLFYKSETYKTLQETENGLWAESDASAIPPLLRLMNFLNKIAQARNILSYSKTDCKKIFCFWKIILHIF